MNNKHQTTYKFTVSRELSSDQLQMLNTALSTLTEHAGDDQPLYASTIEIADQHNSAICGLINELLNAIDQKKTFLTEQVIKRRQLETNPVNMAVFDDAELLIRSNIAELQDIVYKLRTTE